MADTAALLREAAKVLEDLPVLREDYPAPGNATYSREALNRGWVRHSGKTIGDLIQELKDEASRLENQS